MLLASAVWAPLGAGQVRPNAAAQKLPPLSYVCTMAGDEAVLEDKPGRCPNPKCGMELVPVRLDSKWWCPTHQTVVVRDVAGKCPLDGKDLVQVTLSEYWTCADKPTDRLLEPGNCANGQPRKIGYEVRAHGDHNPRHDGQFFMAEDQWHHIEGTYPSPGLFKLYFYDNFTKPISPKDFTGRVEREIGDKTEKVNLTRSADGKTLQARVMPGPPPVKLKAWVKFTKDTKENLFDFAFDRMSVDPATPPAAKTTAVTPRAPASTPASAPKPTAAASSTPTQAPPAAPPPAAQPPATQAPLILDSPTQIPPALAEALDESKLPGTTPELLVELTARAKEVETLVNEGNLSQVWLPATGTKTVALVLDSRSRELPERQRVAVSASVKRIVTAAWELDAYGDLGNRRKIADAYQRLAAAITDLKAAYAR